MRIGIIATTIAMIAVLAVIAAIATVQLGVFDGEPDDTSTRQRSEPTPDIPGLVAAAVAAQLPSDQAQTDNPPLDPSAELVGLITEPRGPVFTELGQRIRLEVLGVYSDGTSRAIADDAKIVFTSSAPEFVSIDPDGLMVASGNGGADITATYGGFTTQAPAVAFLPMQDIPPFDPELVYFTDEDGSAVILNRIMVHTKNEYQPATSERIAARHDAAVIAEFAHMDAFLIETETSTMEDLEAILDQISNDPDVDEAFPDGFISAAQGPPPETAQLIAALNAEGRHDADAFAEVRLPEAWAVINTLPNSKFTHVNVAVLDSGMYSHECKTDFKDAKNIKNILEHEFPSGENPDDPLSRVLVHKKRTCSDQLDQIAHGTAVVSILAAANNASPGLGGLDGQFSGILASVPDLPYYVLVYGLRSSWFQEKLDELSGSYTPIADRIADRLGGDLKPDKVNKQFRKDRFHSAMSEIYNGLEQIVNTKIKVLNISAGCSKGECHEKITGAVAKFVSNSPHTLVVLAAGNDGDKRDSWGNMPNSVMVVGGTGVASCSYVSFSVSSQTPVPNPTPGGRHEQSDFGADVKIAAPYCVYAVNPKSTGGYAIKEGTSFSAPLVSGTAALLFAIAPELTGEAVKDILVRTADEIKKCTPDCNGWRSLNAYAAVCETLYGLHDKNPTTSCPAPQPAPTQTVGACVPGSIGDTGVRVSAQSFFETKVTSDSYFDSLMTGPVLGLGMEEDFYADNNLAALVWMLRFDVPEDAGEVALNYRWVRVLRGGELSVISTGALEVGGEDHKYVVSLAVKGLTDAPSIWLPGQYFVDAWSTQHDCAVAEWYFEVH